MAKVPTGRQPDGRQPEGRQPEGVAGTKEYTETFTQMGPGGGPSLPYGDFDGKQSEVSIIPIVMYLYRQLRAA